MDFQDPKAVVRRFRAFLADDAVRIIAGDQISERFVEGIFENWSSSVTDRVLTKFGYVKFTQEPSITFAQPGEMIQNVAHTVIPSVGSSDVQQLNQAVDKPQRSLSTDCSVAGTLNNDNSTVPVVDVGSYEQNQEGLIGSNNQVEPIVSGRRKRDGEDSSCSSTATAKRSKTTKSPVAVPDSALTEMRLTHSKDGFNHLLKQNLQYIPNWQDATPYSAFEISGHSMQYLNRLSSTMVHPETIVQALQVLATVSAHKNQVQMSQPEMITIVPIISGSGESISGSENLNSLVQASRRAHDYVTRFELEAYEARLRLIMSYITLFLTLEYAITRHMIAQNPRLGLQKLKGQRWKVFYDMLGGEKVLGCKLQTLKDNVGYGKVLWTWVTDCGIVWIPILAVLEKGVVHFVKQNNLSSHHSTIVANQIATQDLWRAFSKGMSGVILNLLFGLKSPVYTVPELVSRILAFGEDLRTMSHFQNSLYHAGLREILFKNAQEALETLHIKEAVSGTIFALFQVTLHDMPTISFSFSTGRKLNLITWVLSAKKEDIIEVLPRSDFALNSISVPISQLASLFWPGPVMSVVISGLIRLWDVGALYGWLGVSLHEATCLLRYKASKSFRPALQGVLKSEYDLSEINHVVLPFETPHSYYLLVCSIKNKQVTLINWLFDGDNEDWLKQTTKTLSMLPLFQGWTIDIETQDPTDTQQPLKKREIGLLMLYTIRFSLNRMRPTTVRGEGEDTVEFDDIVVMCLRDVYVWRLTLEKCILRGPE